MGIRFLCPNGHKLNVKAFLAGKRGICPKCDAKFLVPAESGDHVPAIEEMTESALETPAVPAPPPTMPVAAGLPPTINEQVPPEVWYVRTVAGDQFGPASLEVMHRWVADGRVTVDCWVWRTGWPDWKTGGQALTLLNGSPPGVSLPEIGQPPALPAELPNESSSAALPEPTSATAKYRSSKRSRQDRARKATFFLGAVVLLLVAVLVVVLINNSH